MLAHWHVRSALLALLLVRHSSTAQDTSGSCSVPTFHSNASEVRVTFFATDGHNQSVENLTKADFAVVDNDMVVRNFRSLARSEETSLDIVALVDVSESVTPRFRAAMSDVLQLASREQSMPDDKLAVLSFGGLHPAILCARSCRASGVANRLLTVKSSGLTPLYDGLAFGVDYIVQHRRPGVRAVLILFSDGRDTVSLHSAGDAIEAAIGSGVLVYTVDIGSTQNDSQGSATLQRISEATGGRYFPVRDGTATVLKTVLEDLRSSYVVTYELPNRRPGFHTLQLMPTHNLNLRFHNRNGYSYEKNDR
jgi:Ca-activated chloride channel family protein